jgi:hypothetical protein
MDVYTMQDPRAVRQQHECVQIAMSPLIAPSLQLPVSLISAADAPKITEEGRSALVSVTHKIVCFMVGSYVKHVDGKLLPLAIKAANRLSLVIGHERLSEYDEINAELKRVCACSHKTGGG